ncbi:hypothetical protein, unlikely [Trypanosoma brucei brucei TREU927]|uniref:Uncharacterized protein n=1 Tax=Trypanosoma brucei brucei (strain 927/4 GUTat10.1) TaxID=185431 RepID=Q4GY85_TRYB2|nr:hypothetical protein, unlikely [Trypanosoma brucei brucei TREU927]CAJ16701.1 hypothetical protein, unlikely [Trypanosoma brucei brucei TREU927]
MTFIHFRLRCSSMSLLQHPSPYRDDETRVDIITHAFSDMFFFLIAMPHTILIILKFLGQLFVILPCLYLLFLFFGGYGWGIIP